MKHLSMALCCVGFAVIVVGLAALGVVGSPILLMAVVCPAAMAGMLWWHGRDARRDRPTSGSGAERRPGPDADRSPP